MNIEPNSASLRLQAAEDGYVFSIQDRQDLQTEYQRICAFWPNLTETERATLVSEGTLTTQIETNNNQHARGKYYEGRSEFRSVYVHVLTDQEIILPNGQTAEAHGWLTVEARPGALHSMLGYGLTLSQQAQVALVTVNGGTFPVILEPDPEPNPISESETP